MTKLNPETLSRVVLAEGDPIVDGEYCYYYDGESGNIFRAPVEDVDLKWISPLGDLVDSWRVVAATRAPDIPVYPHSATYAAVHNEEATYQACNHMNSLCCRAISQVIRANGDGYHLNADSVKLLDVNFGLDRTAFVCANSVRTDAHATR